MKYNIGDKFYSAIYRICQTDSDTFMLDYFVKEVTVKRIVITKSYIDAESNIIYDLSNGQQLREHENLEKLGLFLERAKAREFAREQAIMLGKNEIRDYESDIREKQQRIKELEQSIKEIQ